MQPSFCEHLEEYGAQFQSVQNAYQSCNELLANILLGGADADSVGKLTTALERWLTEDRKLRAALLDLAKEGGVRIPKVKQNRRHPVPPICAECGFKIPRLKTPDWEFAGNGAAAFRGQELPLTESFAEKFSESGSEKVGA